MSVKIKQMVAQITHVRRAREGDSRKCFYCATECVCVCIHLAITSHHMKWQLQMLSSAPLAPVSVTKGHATSRIDESCRRGKRRNEIIQWKHLQCFLFSLFYCSMVDRLHSWCNEARVKRVNPLFLSAGAIERPLSVCASATATVFTPCS